MFSAVVLTLEVVCVAGVLLVAANDVALKVIGLLALLLLSTASKVLFYHVFVEFEGLGVPDLFFFSVGFLEIVARLL